MKTILYATDYSENSIAALHYAHTFAKAFNAQLVVMHVFDIPISLVSTVSMSYIKKERKRFAEHQVNLESFCIQHLGDPLKETDIKFVVDEDGSVVSGIQEKALEANANIIILGAKGESALKDFFLGTTAEGLLNKAPCPVLTVPRGASPEKIKMMVYATDFEQADIFALKKLSKIASTFNATINVIHITTKKEYAGDQQMEWFKEMLQEKVHYDKIVFNLIYSDDVQLELNAYLQHSKADLLAMLERKEGGFFQTFFKGDLVRNMEKNTNIPLLSYNVINL